MNLLNQSDKLLSELYPALHQYLSSTDFHILEGNGSSVMSEFKASGACSSLIKEAYGGAALTAWQAVQLQMAIGAYSPSLAIGAGMHQFSIASLQELAKSGTGLESLLLEAIAKNNMLISSAFSEGDVGKSILQSKIIAKPHGSGYLVSGLKKPCSLAHSMDILTASVRVEPVDEAPYLAVALIHKSSEGVSVEPFWCADFLKGSESEAVYLDNVYVPQAMLVNIDESSAKQAQKLGFVWFELLTCASYLGMVYGAIKRIDKMGRLHARDKSTLLIQLESAGIALKAIALELSHQGEDLLAHVLSVRYQMQSTLATVLQQALSQVGGIGYINQPYFASIAQTVHAFNFHPPSKHTMVDALNRYFDGQPLEMV